MDFKPEFMAMCLDGMPRRGVEEACRVMVRNFPECTTVPMPTLSQRIWIEKMPCIEVDREKKRLYFQLTGREHELVAFYEHYMAGDLDYFAISPELDASLYAFRDMYQQEPWSGLRLVHFNVPGLYSWGLSVMDEKGVPALYNDTLKDVILKQLSMKARWRERKIMELFPGMGTFVTIGDGALAVFNSAGGTGTWDRVKEAYNEMLGAIDGLTCIHCCANFDWSLLMQTNTGCINFDAFQYGETLALYAPQLKAFLDRGGTVAWGIVPTAGTGGDIATVTPEALVKRLEDVIQAIVAQGIDRKQLMEASWVSPSCETNPMSIALADRVYEFTHEVSVRLHRKYFSK